MPISLPPLSRRRFLSRTLMAGAGAALASRLSAQDSPPDENTWALLADIHIAADRTTTARGINMGDHLGKAGQELAALTERPGGVFILGDLAHVSGETNDYATVSRLLEPIRKAGLPVHLALGNHDHRERFWDALKAEKALKRPVVNRHVMLVQAPRVNWYVLDSLEKTLVTPGFIGAEQLEWLAKSLDENSQKPAVILVHHNPGKLSNVEGVKDSEALFKVLRPRKQVKAYIFGHTHNWSMTEDESGIHLINLPPVAYVFKAANPSGWIKASVQENGLRLELRCINPAHSAHGKVAELKWRT